jgi:hypothetical protein
MPILEIQSREDAEARLTKFFPALTYAKQYIELVWLLSQEAEFAAALADLSKAIWVEYNSKEMQSSQNRFTRSILNLAQKYGLNNQMNVVLTDAAQPNDFGNLIKEGLLWKDSFAPGHGEFAHSYQWLSASAKLNWTTQTGEIYKAVAGVKSTVPFFVKDEGPITLRYANLWEWLVDCTEYQAKFDAQAEKAAAKWSTTQLEAWCTNQPTNGWFIKAFFRGEDPDIKSIMKAEVFEAKFKPRRGTDPGLLKEIQEGFSGEIAAFHQAFYNDLYPVRNALSNSYRNANTVTRLAKSKKTGNTSADWFISYYEEHRASTLQAREQALTPHMVEAKLQANFGADWDVGRHQGLIGTELAKPTYGGRTDFNTVKKAAKEALSVGLRVSKGVVDSNLRGLQAIDIGKESVKRNYENTKNQQAGWYLRNAADTDRSIFMKKPGAQVDKDQKVVTFHDTEGLINAKALG